MPWDTVMKPEPFDNVFVNNWNPKTVNLQIREASGVRVMKMNRKTSNNLLSPGYLKELHNKFKEFDTNQNLSAAIFSASEDSEYFCQGISYSDLITKRDGSPREMPLRMKYLWDMYQMNYYLGCAMTPLLAWMNGAVEGSGVGLTHTQFPISTDKTKWSVPQCRQGFFPDAGSMHKLANLPKGLGMYLALTGDVVEGFDVYRAELSSNHCASEDMDEMAANLSSCKSRFSTNHFHYGLISQHISFLEEQEFEDEPLGDGRSLLKEKWDMIDDIFGGIERQLEELVKDKYLDKDTDEEFLRDKLKDLAGKKRFYRPIHEEDCVESIFDKLKAASASDLYNGYAKHALQLLAHASPFCLTLTYEMLRKVQFEYMSLAQVLQQDYRVACRLLLDGDSDFYKALSKESGDDSSIKWNHKSLSSIHVEELRRKYLSPFTEKELNISLLSKDGVSIKYIKELDFPEDLVERNMPLYRLTHIKMPMPEIPLMHFDKTKRGKKLGSRFLWSPDLLEVNPRKARRSVRHVVDKLFVLPSELLPEDEEEEDEEDFGL